MKKLLFTLAILSGGVLSAAFAQITSRTLPDEARNVKNDPGSSGNFWKSRGIFRNGKCLLKEVFNKFVP